MADSGHSLRSSNREPYAAVPSTRKLIDGDTVEVRSEDEGFLGSWHNATVISCGPCRRKVRYLDVLEDNGCDHLVGTVCVSPALDGIPTDNVDLHNYRGLIRPPPPDTLPPRRSSCSPGPLDFSYGLCVDARYRDAWWEGVIFDVRQGAPQRNVFFPDLGDEMLIDGGDVRVTQDWDESKGNWRVRGDWLFLQLIEEYEQEWPLAVSVKQIWYDVRQKEAFRGMEWTSTNETLWRMLVLETIKENLEVAAVGIIPRLQLPPIGCSAETCAVQTESSNMASIRAVGLTCYEDGVDARPENDFLAGGKSSQNTKVHASYSSLDVSGSSDSKETPLGSLTAVKDVCRSAAISGQVPPKNSDKSDISISHAKGSENSWQPARLPLSAGYHPEAITMFLRKKCGRSFLSEVRAHLLFLGWKIEVRRVAKGLIFRYISPDKGSYYSLWNACQVLMEYHRDVCTPGSKGASKSPVTGGGDLGRLNGKAISRSRLPDLRTHASDTRASDTLIHFHQLFPGFYDQEKKYSKVEPREITGWGNGKPRANNRCRKRRWVGINLSLFNVTETKGCVDALAGVRIPDKDPSNGISSPTHGILGGKAPRKLSTVVAMGVRCKTWEFRHSRRVAPQVVPSAAHHNPRTVLSWLIDNNILLPRAKVCYSQELSYGFMAEGRVNREGIKCSCCNVLFTLRGFSRHADRRHVRTSSCIFLEDGRSLLDCQIQMLRNKRMVGFSSKPYDKIKSKVIRGRSDTICSVCHYGGQLLLCDQCPSAFHKGCLGLEEVPDGDWICPSCCCCICGQSKIREDIGNILTCDQCRQKFHMHCLKYEGSTKVTRYQRKSWYCSKKCAEISLGLSALSGKPVELGQGNLTWTMLQPVEIDVDNVCAPSIDDSIEFNSKLNVAVNVIHECFEPVKEFQTRDLIEDVVFSRGSPLARLNFKGFYTVLLERNDELISVACVRVHGENLAEVPLVATRFQYRRQGMCRILINELEKKLKELGVGKLILPAVLSVLSTWTHSFKFTRMTAAERLKYLNYVFLDFQDTIMCQKHLTDSSSSEIVKVTLPEVRDTLMGAHGNVDLDGSTTVSEVLQAENEESGSVNQDDGVDVSNVLQDWVPAVPSTGDGLTMCLESKINPRAQLPEKLRSEEAILEQSPVNFDKKCAYSVIGPLKYFYKRRRKH